MKAHQGYLAKFSRGVELGSPSLVWTLGSPIGLILTPRPKKLIQLPNLPFQVRNCDKGLSKVRWTKYLSWQDKYGPNMYKSKRYKRRFCIAQNREGILEERYEQDECCKNQTICLENGEYLESCKRVPLE